MKREERSQVSQLPVSELKVRLRDCEEKMFRLQFKHKVSPLKNGLEIQSLRRHRAQILTWIRQSEIRETAVSKGKDGAGN
ncbi:MAG: 50S ribosomal protein L29 [Elusimicrobia bacterium]|nr:50S ribosomal protein L29 [Elusimicrobiota bacterium]MBI4217727.1 50S ribosomal protein L29 [Elusimicrobiota bacterium]